MGIFSLIVWTVIAVLLGILAGFQSVDELAEALAIMATFAAGGAFATLLAVIRAKLAKGQGQDVGDRLSGVEERLGLTEEALSSVQAQREFDRMLGGASRSEG